MLISSRVLGLGSCAHSSVAFTELLQVRVQRMGARTGANTDGTSVFASGE